MNRKINKRSLGGLLCLLFALLLALPAAAAGDASLTVLHGREGVRFDVYQAAVPGSGGWQLTGAFAGYSVEVPGSDSPAADWRAAAETLAAYAAQDGLTPDASGTIDGGQAVFDGLAEGLYLVVGQRTQQDGVIYTPAPVLVAVGGSTSVEIKTESETLPPEEVEYSLVKVWAGGQSAESVTVQLLRDGQPDRLVTLSEANGWRYSWTSEPGVQWQAAEQDVPEGFLVSVDREGNTFTVTNTWQSVEEPAPPDTSASGEGTLPQTGQLWWPVPVLLCAGAALLIADRVRARRKGRRDDA